MPTRRRGTVREAGAGDLALLEQMENRCFSKRRRSSRRALRRSLSSSAQCVWVAEVREPAGPRLAAAMVLYLYPKTIRIYSLAVLPPYRGTGWGGRLVRKALQEAERTGRVRVSLEAEEHDRVLVGWYRSLGFQVEEKLAHYYGRRLHAVRMRRNLSGPCSGGRSRGRT